MEGWSLLRQNDDASKKQTDLPGKIHSNCQENQVPQMMPAIWCGLNTDKRVLSTECSTRERKEALFLFSISTSTSQDKTVLWKHWIVVERLFLLAINH